MQLTSDTAFAADLQPVEACPTTPTQGSMDEQTSQRADSPTPVKIPRTRASYSTFAAAQRWQLTHDDLSRAMDPSASIPLPAFFAAGSSSQTGSIKLSEQTGSSEQGHNRRRGQQEEARRLSNLVSALGIVGLTEFVTGDSAEAQEIDEGDEDEELKDGTLGRPSRMGSLTFEDETPLSGSEGFQSADEGDDGVWSGAGRRGGGGNSSIIGRLSRRTSRSWSASSSPRQAPTSDASADTSVPMLVLPSILDTSPVMTRRQLSPRRAEQEHRPAGSFPVTPDFGEGLLGNGHDVIETPRREDGEIVSPSSCEIDKTASPPSSVRQLVQQAKRLARSSSREFTAADERRLSIRKMERAQDGLGLNLELFEADHENPAMGSESAAEPNSALCGDRPLRLSRSSVLDDGVRPYGFTSGAIPPPASLSRAVSDGVSATNYFDHAASRKSASPLSSPLGLASPASFASALESPPLELATTSDDPMMHPPQHRKRSTLVRPKTATGFSSPQSAPFTAAFSSSRSFPNAENGPIAPEKVLQRRVSVDESLSRTSIPRSRQSSSSSDLPTSKSSRRLSNFFSKLSASSLSKQSDCATPRPRTASTDEGLRQFGKSQSSSPNISGRATPGRAASIATAANSSPNTLAGLNTLKNGSLRVNSASGTPRSGASASPGTNSPSSPFVMSPSPMQTRTWRSMMSGQEYDELLSAYGALEMKRQEVIWELGETERSFVEALKGALEAFALPLRDRRRGWIRGVPVVVSRLFDWAADIVYLHSQIFESLQKARGRKPSMIVTRIADVFLPFVPQLEIHQPYLVRFEIVTHMIERMTANPDSDFGAFVRLQSRSFLGGMSLSSFLLKPVQRLMKYPLFFKQLCDLTPESHPDHSATLSLLHRTDIVIRVMQEVKSREDEYEEAKLLEARMRGLPEGFRLAKRDRRLLAHGPMRRVHIGEKDRAALLEVGADGYRRATVITVQDALNDNPCEPLLPPVRLSPWLESNHRLSGVSDSGSDAPSSQSGNDRNSWPSPVTTPDATPSNNTPLNSTPAPSKSSLESPARRGSFASMTGASSPKPFGAHDEPSALATSLFKASFPAVPFAFPAQTVLRRNKVIKTRAKESSVHVFIYSDVVILATRSSESSSSNKFGIKSSSEKLTSPKATRSEANYRVIETIGVSRVAGVSDLTGGTEHDQLLVVDLVPHSSSLLAQPAPRPISIFLTLAPSASSTLARTRWLEAFENCLRASDSSAYHTALSSIHALNIPVTHAERTLANSATHSPGQGYIARFESPEVAETNTEREEREWWAVRFRRMKAEFDSRRGSSGGGSPRAD